MADEPGKTPGTPKEQPSPQIIPLSKIHDLPGVFIQKQPDKSYGGLVSSIQASGVKEPVILRLREDGEYQLVTGYRRRRGSELAKKEDIPAHVYEMTLQEAVDYHRRVQHNPSLPIPGKLVAAPTKDTPGKDGPSPKESKETQTVSTVTGPKAKEPPAEGKAEGKPDGKAADAPKEPTPAKDDPAPKEDKKAQAAPVVIDPKAKEPPTEGKAEVKPDGKAADTPKETVPAKDDPAPKEDKKAQAASTVTSPKPKEPPVEGKAEGKLDSKATAVGPAAKGPAGTQITQVFPDRLTPPDEKALKDLPSPKEGESYFIVLHPGYLEKSKYNTITVDQNSEDYRELKKSIELNGVKDPVLTRINPEGGGLEIVSGQRRHMIARELNYPVPVIIQKLDDADVKILVNDGNLHRPHISTYDLARALRGKMEGMKQKSGRKKKGAPSAEELNSDEKLAQEMGMSVSKLNRIIRLSEASKDVCDRVDDGSLALSIASAISFLKPDNQDEVLHLMDLGYRVSTERVEYLKKVEKAGKLDESSMRLVLEGENVLDPPKVVPTPQAPVEPPSQERPSQKPADPSEPVLPPSPDMKPPAQQSPAGAPTPQTPPAGESPAQTPPVQAPGEPSKTAAAKPPAKEQDESKGEQERPEYTKIILTGDRLRKYFPDVSMTPREIEESIYDALEERQQRLEKRIRRKTSSRKVQPGDDMEFTAVIANLGKHAEGIVVETPLSFPTTTKQVQEALRAIGVDGVRYEEVMVKDYSIGIEEITCPLGEAR